MSRAARSLWHRQGCLVQVPSDHAWWASHAQGPVVHPLADDHWRIFFAGRDRENRSSVLSVDVDPLDDMRVIALNDTPAIAPGPAPQPHCDGILLSQPVARADGLGAYSSELARVGKDGKYRIVIGWLISQDQGQSFQRPAQPSFRITPGQLDPAFQAYPMVQPLAEGWGMWFADGLRWDMASQPGPEIYYDIKQAYSPDGQTWQVDPDPAIALAPGECGLFRPWVQQDDATGQFEMLFCTRGPFDATAPERRFYRIGYASSADGRTWQRQDAAFGFTNPPGPGDWDHRMQCYPSIARSADGAEYLFYCGDAYGKYGFGYAKRV